VRVAGLLGGKYAPVNGSILAHIFNEEDRGIEEGVL
jgi:hypothetical protein